MIIRKPYAFLVKNFRLIHALLLIPILYLTYVFYNLSLFFNNFIKNNYITTQTSLVSHYLNFIVPIAILLIIFGNILMFMLYKNKEKKDKTYTINLIFYSIMFIVYLIYINILNRYETTTISTNMALMTRDITNFIFYFQFIFIFTTFLKVICFDLSNFEFYNIKDELNIDDEDSEEVEIKIGIEDYKIKRNIRRTFRELKYYIIENKYIFILLSIITFIIITFFTTKAIIASNHIVKIDQSFSHSNFNLSFNDSILTTIDYNGKTIKDDKYYLAVKVTVTNKTSTAKSLDTDSFDLSINGQDLYPIPSLSSNFLDLAKPYYGEQIAANNSTEYVLAYELNKNQVANSYTIKVLDSISYTKTSIIPKYKEITLNPTKINTINNQGTFNKGDTITFNKTNLQKTTLQINDYSVTDQVVYTYDYCYNETCTTSNKSLTAGLNVNGLRTTLLVLDGILNLDSDASYTKYQQSNNNFFKDFGLIEYTINGSTNVGNITNVTPSNLTDKIILQIPAAVSKASSINLILTIRNQKTTIKLL